MSVRVTRRAKPYQPVGATNPGESAPLSPPKRKCISCTNVLLFLIFALMLTTAIVFGVEGIKTKPVAMEMMGRFVGISETVNMGRALLESDDITTLVQQGKQVAEQAAALVPMETLEQWVHKSTVLLNSVSEEDLVALKTNAVKISELVAQTKPEDIQHVLQTIRTKLDELDMAKLNALAANTQALEEQMQQKLDGLHEIKIQI